MNEKNEGLRAAVRKAAQKSGGMRSLAASLCVSRMTLARLLNGQAVRRETESFIKEGLKGGDDWEAFLLHMQAAKGAKNGFFASDWVLRMISLVKGMGESLRQIALKTGVCYVTLHRLLSGRAVSCVFIWEFIKKLAVYSPRITWAAYKESCEYKNLTEATQPQYATPTQPQYATPAQTQYATPAPRVIPSPPPAQPEPEPESVEDYLAGMRLC